jgi:biopolymer transport protein ExbD
MQLRKPGAEQPDINLTSLIDVVFLLLIFFMITTTFQHSTALKVALPEADSAADTDEPDMVMLSISADGRFALDDDLLDGDDVDLVRDALTRRWRATPDATLVINADAETAHRHVVTALDAASGAGIDRLSIATERRPDAAAETPGRDGEG